MKIKRGQDALITAEENKAMFEYIAPYYDSTNRLLSLGLDAYWRKAAVRTLAPAPGRKYLDVGCGTGDTAIEILNQSPESTVVGVDPSDHMLALGLEKIQHLRLEPKITLQKGDALNLEYNDNEFDSAITSFCIRNVTDRKRALVEIRRVIKPGGRLIILELTEPQGQIMKPLFRLYSLVVMPIVTGLLSSASAYKYLADSMADFPKPGDFLGVLEVAGYKEVRFKHLTGGIVTIFEAGAGK
jgi:demethylmenaquinone methyltransferase / 2-methoxy-6-polyprenyl-1,4-benzoquinol methylase